MTKSLHTFGEETLGQAPQVPDLFEEDQPMTDARLHEPGPSFVPNDVPAERLAEMPAWLQTFAAQEMPELEDAEPDASHQADPFEGEPDPVATAVELPSDDIILPDWLQDSGPALDLVAPVAEDDNLGDLPIDAVAAAPFLEGIDEPVSTNPDTFISEDDLPDWLRAFSEETAPDQSQQVAQDIPGGVPLTEPVAVRVPPVENIWLSDNDRRALGPGGTLFALLAANKETDDVEDDLPQETDRTSPAAPVVAKSAEATEGTPDQDEAAKRRSRQLLLLTLAIVVLVILVSYMAFR